MNITKLRYPDNARAFILQGTGTTWFAFLLMCFAPVLSAQNGYGVISGRVQDISGGVIPGVPVSAKDLSTNVVTNVVSNSNGYYILSNLIPATYSITAQQSGFKNLERSGIVLRVGDHLNLDLVLEVGSPAEHVTVTGQASLLRSDDAQAGMVIDNRRIQELPQYDRNVLGLATLTANVNGTSEQEGASTDFRINGGRTGQAEYYVDGVPITTSFAHNVPSSVPSMEAVDEFNVVTNGLSAEFGRLSGGGVVLATRSGTNEFHGSGYEYLRNNHLNANTWSANRLGRPIGVFHDNVFGGTFGGPVVLPKIHNGHNKTFFFFNYEGTRHVSGSNASLAGVPTALERQGDFSQSLIGNGRPVTVYDPNTGQVTSSGDVIRQPFPGNIVPASRFDPLSAVYLGYYPMPNTAPLPGSSDASNYAGASVNPQSDNRWTGRLDQNWSSNQSTHFTLTLDDFSNSTPRWLSPLQTSSASSGTSTTVSIDHIITLSPTTVLDMRAGLVRLTSLNQTQVGIDATTLPLDPLVTTLLGGSPGRAPSLTPGGNITALGGGGVNNLFETNYSGQVSLQKVWGKHTAKFGVETRRYYVSLYGGLAGQVGYFTASSPQSATSQSYTFPALSGYNFASWLLGGIEQAEGNEYSGPATLQRYWAAYAEDSYKVNSKLTLTYGMRWDYEPPMSERHHQQYYWDPNYKWSITPNAGWSWDSVLQQAGLNPATTPTPSWMTNGILGRLALINTSEYPTDVSQVNRPYHFSPHAGIAYQLLPHTVLRASYGINFLTVTGDQLLDTASYNVGFADAAHISNGTGDGGLTYLSTFSHPFPGGFGYVPRTTDVNQVNYSTMGQWLWVPDYNLGAGYEHTVSLGLQREIGTGAKSWVLELNYNGNFGRGLPVSLGDGEHIPPNAYNILSPLGNALTAQVTNPFYGQVPGGTLTGSPTIALGRLYQLNPLWEEIWTLGGPYANTQSDAAGLSTWGLSNYNALVLQAEHRYGNGFSFLINYTFSKLLQDAGNIQGSYGYSQYPQAGLGLGDSYSLATTNFTHKLLFNYSVDLPFGRGRRFLRNAAWGVDALLGGWRLAGTTTFRSGQPIYVYNPSGGVGGVGSAWYNIGLARQQWPIALPNVPLGLTTDGHSALVGSSNFKYYVNPAAYTLPSDFSLGNVPAVYGDWVGPAFSQWDMAIMKDFRLGNESRRLQLRFEAQNVFNHMNAANPNTGVTNSTFGVITAPAGNPRQAMVAAKIVF